MSGPTTRRNQAVSLQQATQESPMLARLAALSQDSLARLQAILPLIPPGLRTSIQAGPIDGASWCLLLDNNAAAAKLRQLLPALEARLRTQGWAIETIRLKVHRKGLA